jgi:hypothetical protein
VFEVVLEWDRKSYFAKRHLCVNEREMDEERRTKNLSAEDDDAGLRGDIYILGPNYEGLIFSAQDITLLDQGCLAQGLAEG